MWRPVRLLGLAASIALSPILAQATPQQSCESARPKAWDKCASGINGVVSKDVAATASSGIPRAQRSHTETFEAVAFVDSATDVDNPPSGDSQGDIITFTQNLFSDTTKERQVGTDEVYCLRTISGTSRVCTGLFYLPGGTIAI